MHSLPELISRVTRLRVEEGREGEREREREKLECTIVHGRRDANLQPRSFFFFLIVVRSARYYAVFME